MAATTKRLTYDDLESIPQEREGDRHELIDGMLVVTPVRVPLHQIVSVNIMCAWEEHVRERDLGMVLPGPIDVRFTPHNVLVPDIIYIAKDRLHVIGPKAVDAPPDLIAEILSPDTHERDVTTKRALYARFGVQEYWIVDLDAYVVTVLALDGDHFEPMPSPPDGLIRSQVLPGLALPWKAAFDSVAELKRQHASASS
jgi:Uma2 family endonuclease